MANTLGDRILKPALRIAGITMRPGITPNDDQFAELIPEINSMLASWNCDGQKVFSTKTQTFDLTSGQKIYTIGVGGDFNTARPLYIKAADVLYPTDPTVRYPLDIYDYDQWSRIIVQDIPGAPPSILFYNPTFDTSAGLGTIYLKPQPPADYSIELWMWMQLKTDFSSISDAMLFPPGYEDAIKWNLAIRCADFYPHQAKISPRAEKQAALSLQTLIALNVSSPKLRSDPALLKGTPSNGQFGIVVGGQESSGGAVRWIVTTTSPDSSRTEFVFAEEPVYVSYNGVNQFDGTGYNVIGVNTIELIDVDGNVITPQTGDDIRAEVE
jgi:hypothetical protein